MSSKVILSVFLFLYATMASAVPVYKFASSLGLAVENSDNVYLSSTNIKSDDIIHATFSTSYIRNSPTVQTLFSLNVDHQHYQNKSFSDQTIFNSSLGFNSDLIKNRLTWNVTDNFQRVPVNYLVPANLPTNQQNVNYFNTGPTFVVLRDDRQFLNISLSYNKTYAQKTDIDSSGHTAEAAYNRNLTRTFSVRLRVKNNVRNFVNTTVNTDYSRTDSTITFSKRMKLSVLDLTGGRTNLVRENVSNPNISGSIFRVNYKYQAGEKASLNLNYDRELGDYSGLLSTAITNTQALPTVSSDIFLMKRGKISISRKLGNSSIAYNYNYFTTDYHSNKVFNHASKTSQLVYTAHLSPTLELSLSGAYQITTYDINSRRDVASIYTGNLSKKMANRYDLAFQFQYFNSNSNLAQFVYNERRITISGAYHF